MNIIERLNATQKVLEEHCQYDDCEGSGEDQARITCHDAKYVIYILEAACKAALKAIQDPDFDEYMGAASLETQLEYAIESVNKDIEDDDN